MAKRTLQLYTLDYVIPPEEMGDVHVYPLTVDFARMWDDLAQRWDRQQGFKTPHGSLSAALSTVTGRMVIFTVRQDSDADTPLSRRSLIISDGPLDPELTKICFDTWQERHFGRPDPSERLSQFIQFTGVPVQPLKDLLERDDAGYIIGPWWWKKAIGWSVVRRLAPHEVIDQKRPNRKFKFLVSTGGTLVAWEYPWYRTTNEGRANERTSYAMAYVSVRGETRRGCKDPIVRIDCHVTRVAAVWNNVKTVHIKHPQFPTLLRVPVRSLPVKGGDGKDLKDDGGNLIWKTTFRGHTADIVQACELDPITLPANADGDLDHVRPVFRNKGKHPIGKGPGAYFTLRMATHISRVLGRPPIIYQATPYNLPASTITAGPIQINRFPAALAAAGWRSLRIVVLYSHDATPVRVLRTLEADYGIPTPANTNQVGDGYAVELFPGVTVHMCRAPEITMHGDHDRRAAIRTLPSLRPSDPDELIAAVCETSWSGARILNDGKHPTRRDLAAEAIVSQFLVAAQLQENLEDEDFPTSGALRDLLKSCGLVDNRLARALCGDRLEAPLTEPVTLIGIHFRRHVYKRIRGRSTKPPKLVAVLTAVHLDPDPESSPHLQMYADNRWWRYAEGRARFHAGEIGSDIWGRDADGAQAVRHHVENALDALILPPGYSRVVIILDKEGAQSIYPGIGDNPHVTGPMPGRRLADEGIDVAIARIALGQHAPRPATAFRDGEDLETKQPSYYRRVLFAFTEGEESSWLLTHDSPQHQGNKSPLRIGTQRSREDFAEIAPSRMGKDMHATGRVEITVPQPGKWEQGDLAILIARLCEQTISWDNRTSRAVPLHLGYTADKDHPDYSNHDSAGEADEDEQEELADE